MTHDERSNTEHPDPALLASHALLRMVIDANPNIMLVKDWDGRFLLGNRALAKLYGTTPEALVGQDDSAFNPNAEQVAFYLQNVREVMSQDQTQVVMESSTNAATGETAYFQSIKVPLTTPEGQKQILVIANDVTELQRTQQKLEASERRLRYVLEATGEGIWDWDVASNMVTHNRRWCEIAGLTDDFLQHPLQAFADLLHEDDKSAVMARVMACLHSEGRYESEHRLRLGDGRVVWVHDRGAVVERDAQGQPLRVVGSVVDISARKASELAAQRANQLLREAVDHIAMGFSIYDEQDRLYLCNEAYKRIYQHNPLLVPGNNFERIVRYGVGQGHYVAAQSGEEAWVQQRLAQHRRADGELLEQQLRDGRWLLVVESRTPSGFTVGNRLDITERKKAEALALEHAEQLRAVFDLSPDGFVTFDRERRVKSVNPAFCRLSGLDGAALAGLNEALFSQQLAALCLPQARFPGLAALREHKRTVPTPGPASAPLGGAERQLIELSGPVARVLEVRLRQSNLPDVSQIMYLRDITHEAEVERLKSKFMSMAAHELRNPMASIYGFTEILHTHDLTEDERKEFLEIIYRQSEHMMAILNELLDLARIEARRGQDFVFEPLSAQALVGEVVRQFKLPPDRLPPQLMAPDEALFILADQRKAAQAVLNVLSNAYKYSGPNGRVSIQLEARGDGVSIGVMDQGMGMTASELNLVGTPFYRSDTSGRVLGTGLGLSIVKEIMKLHQGRIDIDSTPGQGTRVDLVFCSNRFFPVAAGSAG